MTSLSIAKHVHKALSGSPSVSAIVEGRIFPVVSVNETSFPFIAFTRENVTSSYTKDGSALDTVSVSVYAVSEDYAGSVDLAEAVREALEDSACQVEGLVLDSAEFTGAAEDYEAGAFVQRLSFEFTIKN